MTSIYRDPVDFYNDHALEFDNARSRVLFERRWLDSFLDCLSPNSSILDIGCGTGEPIAAYLMAAGHHVTGVDASSSMLKIAQSRFPAANWIHADMRQLQLGNRFDAIIAWDSFFHLSPDAQRQALAAFVDHASPQATIMFTSGHMFGEAINPLFGEPLYHASLATEEYQAELQRYGFSILKHRVQDIDCGDHTIWLAKRDEK